MFDDIRHGIYDRDHLFAHIRAMGGRMRDSIVAATTKARHPISYTGPVTSQSGRGAAG